MNQLIARIRKKLAAFFGYRLYQPHEKETGRFNK